MSDKLYVFLFHNVNDDDNVFSNDASVNCSTNMYVSSPDHHFVFCLRACSNPITTSASPGHLIMQSVMHMFTVFLAVGPNISRTLMLYGLYNWQ